MKRSKFNTAQNKKDKPIIDGIIFDSDHEAKYYTMLKSYVAMGRCKSFKVHPKYTLIAPFEKYGKKHRGMIYIADFEIIFKDGMIKVVDIKGFATEAAKIKRKLFDAKYPLLYLQWISYVNKHGGFIDYDKLQVIRRRERNERKN